MGRPRDEVRDSFTVLSPEKVGPDGKKSLARVQCKYCESGTVSNSVTRMKAHLRGCEAAIKAGIRVLVMESASKPMQSPGGRKGMITMGGRPWDGKRRSAEMEDFQTPKHKKKIVVVQKKVGGVSLAKPVPEVPHYQEDEIEAFEVFKVPPRWVFLKVQTKQGFVGWGEPSLEGFSSTVATAVESMMKGLIGLDPSRIQYIVQKLRRQKFYGGGPVLMSAISGIDQALWDIAGKTLGVPVHRLLGGAVRERTRVYRWIGGDEQPPAITAAQAVEVLHRSNYKQIKMNACPRMGYIDDEGAVKEAIERVRAVREAVGPAIGIGLDFHGRVKLPMAKHLMKALERFNPMFFEEPVCAGQNKSLKDLNNFTTVPLATGERMYTIEEFRDLFESRSVSIIQPDCSHVGGISQLITLARMAEAYEVSFAPHCPLGPIALASCLQVDACAVNFAFQETSQGIHYNFEDSAMKDKDALAVYLHDPSVFDVDEDGYIARLEAPGLGIEINEAAVRLAAEKSKGEWQDREWTLEDGTPTTW